MKAFLLSLLLGTALVRGADPAAPPAPDDAAPAAEVPNPTPPVPTVPATPAPAGAGPAVPAPTPAATNVPAARRAVPEFPPFPAPPAPRSVTTSRSATVPGQGGATNPGRSPATLPTPPAPNTTGPLSPRGTNMFVQPQVRSTGAQPPAPGQVNPAGAAPGPAGVPAGAPVGAAAPADPNAPGGGVAAVITSTSTNLSGVAGSAKFPEKVINLQVAPLDQVLNLYAELTGRTVLRPSTLGAQTISLRNQQDLTREEAIQALESTLSLNGITMINVGEKFVSAVPTQQALTEGAAFSKQATKDMPEAGQFVTKVVQLTNALPSELVQIIQSFGKVQGGVIPIDSTMTLVLRDYPANVKRMMEIIEKVDVRVESDYKLEVIPIKYGKVEDIYGTMSSLIGGGGGGGMMGGAAAQGARRTSTGARGGGGGARSGGSSYRTNFRQNNLTGMQNQQQRMGGNQLQPQAQNTAGGAASSFNQRLGQLVNRMSGTGGEAQLLGDAKIIPDERSNSLIVFATKEDMTMITNIVSKVDRLLAQVLIEAIIMDVQLDDSMDFAVSALMHPQRNGELTSVAGMNNGNPFLSAVTNLASGSGLPGGFTYFGKYGGDMTLAVKALASTGKGEILATPRIQTSHATPANFTVGQSVPYVTSTYYGGYGYGPSAQLQQLDVETFLDVTPYITPDGLVVMEINQNIEEITGYTEIANVGKMPNTSHRSATATVSVQDHDTIVLGGYIRASKNKSKSGLPYLQDMPLLGPLFRSTSKENKRTEMLVLIRPTVLSSPRDAAEAATKERDRMPGIRDMEQDWKEEYDKINEKSKKRNSKSKS